MSLLLHMLTVVVAVIFLKKHHRQVVKILLDCKAQVRKSVGVLTLICRLSLTHPTEMLIFDCFTVHQLLN